jgi:hypothetical protein
LNQRTPAAIKEVLAVTGLGLFAFGVWMIDPAFCLITVGLILMAPFTLSIRRGGRIG